MVKFLFVMILTLFSTFAFTTWTTSPPASISTNYSFTYASVFSSCNPTKNFYLATWGNENNNQYPTYSTFTSGNGWSSIDIITNASQVLIQSNVITSCDPTSAVFLATWTDSTTLQPTSSVYTPGSGWSIVNTLNTSTSAVNTANTFDFETGKFLVTWAASNNNNYPTYAFYTNNVGWGPISTITVNSKASNVYTSFDAATNQFLAVWVDIETGVPMYSFYSSGTWSSDTPISTLSDVDNDVLCSYNPKTGQFMATWADVNQNLYPFYSIYTPGVGWSAINTITTSSRVSDNVTISCDVITGQFLALWSDVTNGHLTYSFYAVGTGWSQPEVISTTAKSGGDIISCFNQISGEFLSTWADTSNPNIVFNPTYSFFTYILPSPPSSFIGKVLYNRFLTQTEIIHKLEWTPPLEASSIVSYQIKRNGITIAVIAASSPLVFYDSKRNKKGIDVYTIFSINGEGDKSVSLSISL